MKKDNILKALDNMGFSVEEFSENYFHFEYEELNYLYAYGDDDDNFFHLSVPAIFRVSDENVDMVMPVINRTNNIVKYAKISHAQDMVWASIEYPLMEWVDVEELLEFSIHALQNATIVFNRVLRGEFDENEGEEAEK